MFFGQYEHNFDEKGRLFVPAKFKAELANETTLYILQGFEGCISVYTKEHFEKLVSSLESYSFMNKEARSYIRMTLGSVVQLSIDKAGRILISPQILAKYRIQKEAIILGVNDHFEIWDKSAYLIYEEESLENFENNAEALVKNNG